MSQSFQEARHGRRGKPTNAHLVKETSRQPCVDSIVAPMAVDPSALPGIPLGEKLGITILEASSERIVGTMPVEGNTQPYGLLHGGASVALAETLGSIGAMLHAGQGRAAVGVDINATHHRSAKSGAVTGVATAISLGRTLAVYEVVITDENDTRICTSRITCMLIDKA